MPDLCSLALRLCRDVLQLRHLLVSAARKRASDRTSKQTRRRTREKETVTKFLLLPRLGAWR